MPAVNQSRVARGAARLEVVAVVAVVLILAAAGAVAFVNRHEGEAGGGPSSAPAVACLPNPNRLGPVIDLGVEPSTGTPAQPLLSSARVGQLLSLASQAGATIISTRANWSTLQPKQDGSIDFAGLDLVVSAAKALGLKVRVQLVGMPRWAQDQHTGSTYRPPLTADELQRWATFVRKVVERYTGEVQYFEIWNEPDNRTYWPTGPDPTAFVKLLAVSERAVHAVNGAIGVISGGLDGNDVGYLQHMYAAIAAQHLTVSPFDYLGVHPFAGDLPPGSVDKTRDVDRQPFGEDDQNFTGFSKLESVMASHHDDAKIYITEFGYSTQAHDGVKAVSDTVRAGYLTDAFRATTCAPYVFAFSWYALHPSPSVPASWALVDQSLQPNKTEAALAAWHDLVVAATS